MLVQETTHSNRDKYSTNATSGVNYIKGQAILRTNTWPEIGERKKRKDQRGRKGAKRGEGRFEPVPE